MDDNRITNARRRALATALAFGLAAAACAPRAARRQTDVMEKTRALSESVSAAVLRARVDDLAGRLAGRVEAVSDRIRAEAKDPAVRRRALTAKIEGMPAIYSAAYRADPLEALVDVWAFAFQMQHFVDEGAGREVYGPQQPLVRDLAKDVLADVDRVVERVTTGPDAFAKARGDIEGWAGTTRSSGHSLPTPRWRRTWRSGGRSATPSSRWARSRRPSRAWPCASTPTRRSFPSRRAGRPSF